MAVDDNGYAKLEKPILTADKSFFNPSGVFNDIVNLKYDVSEGTTLTVPLAPLYMNDGTSHTIIINLDNYIFVPLFENKIDLIPDDVIESNIDLKRQRDIKKLMGSYIDYIYEEYSKITNILNPVYNKNKDEVNNNETSN